MSIPPVPRGIYAPDGNLNDNARGAWVCVKIIASVLLVVNRIP